MLDPLTLTVMPQGVLTQDDLDRLFSGQLPTEEDFIARDRRTCDCELTYVHRKRHAALGTGIEIRLCCMAKFIEKQFGLPPGTFFFAMEFEPTWVWDCNRVSKVNQRREDGSVETVEVKLGPPPQWLLKRMQAKGIQIAHLPESE